MDGSNTQTTEPEETPQLEQSWHGCGLAWDRWNKFTNSYFGETFGKRQPGAEVGLSDMGSDLEEIPMLPENETESLLWSGCVGWGLAGWLLASCIVEGRSG